MCSAWAKPLIALAFLAIVAVCLALLPGPDRGATLTEEEKRDRYESGHL